MPSTNAKTSADQNGRRQPILAQLAGLASFALRRWCVITAEEASEAAMGRLRSAAVVIALTVAMAVAATVAYVSFLEETILAFRDLDAHPLVRALVPLVLFLLPAFWLLRRVSQSGSGRRSAPESS